MININLLPRNLRRRREPGYWRLVAAVFPLLVLGVATLMHVSATQTQRNLQEEVDLRVIRLSTYQEDLREQRELQARLRQLQELIAIKNSVEDGKVAWTAELNAMLETLPPRVSDAQPRISFTQMSMQALDDGASQQRVSNQVFDGLLPRAEMSIQGIALNAEVLAGYIQALQDSPIFGVSFQNATREEESGMYRFSLTVGAVVAGANP